MIYDRFIVNFKYTVKNSPAYSSLLFYSGPFLFLPRLLLLPEWLTCARQPKLPSSLPIPCCRGPCWCSRCRVQQSWRALETWATLAQRCFNTDPDLLSLRQHAGLWNGWAAVPSVLRSFQQVVSAGSGSHGHGHQISHHGLPSCSTVPPTRSLLQQQHWRCCRDSFFLLLLRRHHSNYDSN